MTNPNLSLFQDANLLLSRECPICTLHNDPGACARHEISRTPLWVLRHHPDPAPLPGWLLLDARRHCGGPIHFTPEEACSWGASVQQASQLVARLSTCERVYVIAFGESARHLHLHLVPRFGSDPASEAWEVADLYRAVARGERPGADPAAVKLFVERARRSS